MGARLRNLRTGVTAAVIGVVLGCSSSPVPVSGSASASGASGVTVRSAALIPTHVVTDAGVGAASTYIEFLTSAPGLSCNALTADAGASVGNLEVSADPATLPGKTLTLGGSGALLAFYPAGGAVDASADGGLAAQLFSVSGTVTFKSSSSGGGLSGTFDATMSLGPTAASTVQVSGSFTAPSCGDY